MQNKAIREALRSLRCFAYTIYGTLSVKEAKEILQYIEQLENKVKELEKAVEQTYSDYQDVGKEMFKYSEQVEQLEEKEKMREKRLRKQLKEFLKLQSRKTFDYLEKMLNEKIGDKIMIFTLKDLKGLLKIIEGEEK